MESHRQLCYNRFGNPKSTYHRDKYKEVKHTMLDASYYRKTDEIISRYVRDARSLIPIMQDIQAEYR